MTKMEDTDDLLAIVLTTYRVAWAILITTCLLGFFYVFYYQKGKDRPRFLYIVWSLILFQMVILAVQIAVFALVNKYTIELGEDATVVKTLGFWAGQTEIWLDAVAGLAHWLFSIEYYKTSLLFPVFMNWGPGETAVNLSRGSCKVLVANCTFYALITACVMMQEISKQTSYF